MWKRNAGNTSITAKCLTKGQDGAAFEFNNSQQLTGLSVLPLAAGFSVHKGQTSAHALQQTPTEDGTMAAKKKEKKEKRRGSIFNQPHFHSKTPLLHPPRSDNRTLWSTSQLDAQMCACETIPLFHPHTLTAELFRPPLQPAAPPHPAPARSAAHVLQHTPASPMLQRKKKKKKISTVQRGSSSSSSSAGASSSFQGTGRCCSLSI